METMIHALAAAVLVTAFESIDLACRPRATAGQLKEGQQAWRWMEAGAAGGVFTYLNVCELLELDPEAGRAFALRIITGEATLAEACEKARLDQAPQAPKEMSLLLTPQEHARAYEILKNAAPVNHQWRKGGPAPEQLGGADPARGGGHAMDAGETK